MDTTDPHPHPHSIAEPRQTFLGTTTRNGEGTGFTDAPESPAERCLLAQRVVQQQKLAAELNPSLHGRVDRAQHQKQLIGLFGSVTIDPGLPASLRVGPLREGGTYKAAVRFSNGQPCPFRDQAPDVRGAAIKFFAADGSEADLLMTNEDERSHARTPRRSWTSRTSCSPRSCRASACPRSRRWRRQSVTEP